MRGRKPRPSALTGHRDAHEPVPPDALPRCPGHLSDVARKEWRRLAKPLHEIGVLTVADRAAFAAYCQAWARWVEAEEKLKETPPLLKTPSGYVQQSPWLSVANKQLEIMGRYMAEMGLTPAARRRVDALAGQGSPGAVDTVEFVVVYEQPDGSLVEESRSSMPMAGSRSPAPEGRTQIVLNGDVAGKL